MGVSIEIDQLCKRFGAFQALDRVHLDIQGGEFLTLLGPSGCGKTTLLRAIAGFNLPDSGSIRLGGEDISRLAPHQRDIGMVFQSYAVFPHMTVLDNVAYGLRARRRPEPEVKQRAAAALEQVQMGHLAARFASQLSGGQKQRVGLARAMVIQPKVLLMDEPLSNLDAKLRVEMRQEIRLMQRGMGITTLYVTHDQEEALAVSDRIAVMSKGHVLQLAPPEQVYRDPAHAFVMDFVGGCNWLPGRLAPQPGGGIAFEWDAHAATAAGEQADAASARSGTPAARTATAPSTANGTARPLLRWTGTLPDGGPGAARLALRAEDLQVGGDAALPGWDAVQIELCTYLGTRHRVRARLPGGQPVELDLPPGATPPREGENVPLRFAPEAVRLFDATTEARLR
jgi:ABC-type Fe3+/spermidine/putrescine transport system ATPase subunit